MRGLRAGRTEDASTTLLGNQAFDHALRGAGPPSRPHPLDFPLTAPVGRRVVPVNRTRLLPAAFTQAPPGRYAASLNRRRTDPAAGRDTCWHSALTTRIWHFCASTTQRALALSMPGYRPGGYLPRANGGVSIAANARLLGPATLCVVSLALSFS